MKASGQVYAPTASPQEKSRVCPLNIEGLGGTHSGLGLGGTHSGLSALEMKFVVHVSKTL